MTGKFPMSMALNIIQKIIEENFLRLRKDTPIGYKEHTEYQVDNT